MTNHTNLIDRLRKDDLFWEAPITCRSEAADALEAAQAEIERLQTTVKHLSDAAANATFAEKAALARLAEIERQEPVAWAKHTEKKLRITAMDMSSEDGWLPLVCAAGASPVQPSQADAQDAARYRWLRLNTNYEDRGTFRAPNGDLVSPMSRRWYHQTTDLASDTLDSAIDAAITAKESK